MRFDNRILLSSPTMHGEEMQFIKEAFDKIGIAPLGFNCDGFEQEMAQFLAGGENHCLALASGTAAIHLAVKLAGVGRGDVVLCSDMTFAATVNPAVYEGATTVFIDSEKEKLELPENVSDYLKLEEIQQMIFEYEEKLSELMQEWEELSLILSQD